MKAARAILVLVGVGCGLWGLWLMREFTSEQLVSLVVWLVAGVLVHDAVLAPVTVALGVGASRLLPRHAALGIAFLVWATLTVTFLPVLSGQGGKPDNDTILNQPYGASWVVMTALLAVGGALAAWAGRRGSPVTAASDRDA